VTVDTGVRGGLRLTDDIGGSDHADVHGVDASRAVVIGVVSALLFPAALLLLGVAIQSSLCASSN